MSPFKRLASKRKATTYSSPQITRERPSIEFSKKEIAYEKVFPTYHLDERAECQWTMSYLGRNNYLNLTSPFADKIYPRLVKLFYQRLTYGSTEQGELFLEFTVDGHHERITTTDLGIITGLPVEYNDTMRHLQPPLMFPSDDCVIEYILKDFGFNKSKNIGESIRVSTLPEGVWLLDRIFKENIYPLGPQSERRTELLLALYSAYEGHFYSIPHLLMTGITKVSQEISDKTRYGISAPLPYGFLITAILRYAEHYFDDKEPTMHMDTLYPISSWEKIYNKLMTAKHMRAEELKRKRAPEGRQTADPNVPLYPEISIEDINYKLASLEEKIEDIYCRQSAIMNNQDDMHLLLKIMAKRQLGDNIEEMVNAERQGPPLGNYTTEGWHHEGDGEAYSDWE